MINAKIICDSISCNGDRLTTFVITFPRFILPEVLTHRDFSRNTSSSRAIPTKKMIDKVIENLVEPVYWGKNKSGMSASEELTDSEKKKALEIWEGLRDSCIDAAIDFLFLGVHKQIANRVLEPFSSVTMVVSSTKWSNFFSLRCDEAAQPEIRELAFKMLKEYYNSIPKQLGNNDWHLPFIHEEEKTKMDLETLKKISVARCARVSYLNHEGNNDPKKDIDLHDRLAENGHWSAFEHIAMPMSSIEDIKYYSNFEGWVQYRKMFAGEIRTTMPTREEVETYFKGQK